MATVSLSEQHFDMLVTERGINPEVVKERGYFSVTREDQLKGIGFEGKQLARLTVPGIAIPICSLTGKIVSHQYRPDKPTKDAKGKFASTSSPLASR
jgi:hypothetical protein